MAPASVIFDRVKREPLSIDVECRNERAIRVRTETGSWSSLNLDVFYGVDARRATARLSRDNATELLHALESVLDEMERCRNEWLASPEGVLWAAEKRVGAQSKKLARQSDSSYGTVIPPCHWQAS